MKIKLVIKSLALLLIMTMIIGCMPAAKVSAEDAGQQVEFSMEDALKLVAKLAGTIPENAFGEAVSWGTGKILDAIFGESMSAQEQAAFAEILGEIKALQSAISNMSTDLKITELGNLLNAYSKLGDNELPAEFFRALKSIDDENWNAERKEQERLSILTDGIGAGEGNLARVDTNFDNYAMELADALLKTYIVSLDGKTMNLTLLQVHYEYLRLKYHWENQALDEWLGFQAQAVANLVQTLTIRNLSLRARIKRIEQYNKEHPESRISTKLVEEALKDTVNTIAKVKNVYGENKDNWLAKPHDKDVRYYWTPGHEMLFYSQVNAQNVPKEPRQNLGWHDTYTGSSQAKEIKGIEDINTTMEGIHIVWAFWKPLFRPRPTRLTTEAELRTIFEDYEGKKTFYEIFIGEDEGNFQGLEGEKNWNWKMVFDPDSHHLEMWWPSWQRETYCTVEGYFFNAMQKGSMPKAEKMKIARYYEHRNREIDDTFFIGIRVKEVAGKAPEIGDVHLEVHWEENPSGWIPEDGNLMIETDQEEHGRILRVEADGTALPSSCYRVTDGLVTLLKDYLMTLTEGKHHFTVYAEGGSMSYSCNFIVAEMVLPEDLREIGVNAFSGIGAHSVRIQDGCARIGASAFAGNEDLTWAYIPDSVKEIEDKAFADCPNLILICGGKEAAAYAKENGLLFRMTGERQD